MRQSHGRKNHLRTSRLCQRWTWTVRRNGGTTSSGTGKRLATTLPTTGPPIQRTTRRTGSEPLCSGNSPIHTSHCTLVNLFMFFFACLIRSNCLICLNQPPLLALSFIYVPATLLLILQVGSNPILGMEWNGMVHHAQEKIEICYPWIALVPSSLQRLCFICFVCVCVCGGGTAVSLHLPGNDDSPDRCWFNFVCVLGIRAASDPLHGSCLVLTS